MLLRSPNTARIWLASLKSTRNDGTARTIIFSSIVWRLHRESLFSKQRQGSKACELLSEILLPLENAVGVKRLQRFAKTRGKRGKRWAARKQVRTLRVACGCGFRHSWSKSPIPSLSHVLRTPRGIAWVREGVKSQREQADQRRRGTT
jgi:hypothetical protein